MITPHDTMLWALRHVYRTAGEVTLTASIIANLLPPERRLARWPRLRSVYSWLCDCVALLAVNLRVCIPCLDLTLFGFRIQRVRLDMREIQIVEPED